MHAIGDRINVDVARLCWLNQWDLHEITIFIVKVCLVIIIEHVLQNAHINTLLIDLAKEPQEENTIPSRFNRCKDQYHRIFNEHAFGTLTPCQDYLTVLILKN